MAAMFFEKRSVVPTARPDDDPRVLNWVLEIPVRPVFMYRMQPKKSAAVTLLEWPKAVH